MFHVLLAVLAYYPQRESLGGILDYFPNRYLQQPDCDAVRYRILEMPPITESDDEGDGAEARPTFSYYQAEKGNVSDELKVVLHTKQVMQKARMETPSCAHARIALAFVAAAPLTRHAVEMSGTAGTVYFAPMASDANGAPLEPDDDGAPAETSIVCRQPVVSIRVGAIERETGDVFKAKTDYDAYDPPYVGCDSDWRQHKLYRQLTIHTTRLVAGSVAWRVLEASAWWWRDRRMPVSKSTHPICVSSVSLEGPVSFPRALFGDDGLLQVVRIRSFFAAHPYFVSDAVVDVAALAHTHGDYLTEMDLYGADRCENLMPGLASGSFTALVYANLARTIFSEAGWRAARVGLDVVGAAGTPALPCLEELVLDGCHHLRQLDADILAHMPNLRKLNVFNCTKLRVIRDLAVCCPYLTQLCVNYTHVTVLDFGIVPENGATLKTASGKPQIAGRPARASHLQVVDLKNSTFDSLEWLAQTPSLDTLVFSGFHAVDGVALSCLSFTRYVRKINLFWFTVGNLTALSACTFLEELLLIGVNPPDDQANTSGIDIEPILLAGATASDPRPLQRLRHFEMRANGRPRIDYRSDIHGPPTDTSDTAVAVARSLSMLAVSLDSLETLILADYDDFDDLHSLLTLPNGDEHLVVVEAQQKDAASAEVYPASTPRHYVPRFPHLKVLDVSSTQITEMDPIVHYCPNLETLKIRRCAELRHVTRSLETLSGAAGPGHSKGDDATDQPAAACSTRPLWPRLQTVVCGAMGGIAEEGQNYDEWLVRFYTVLSRVCPVLEALHTSDGLPVFHSHSALDTIPVFPHLRDYRGYLGGAEKEAAAAQELQNVLPLMMPALERLELLSDASTGSGEVSCSPIASLDELPRLKCLEVSGCDLAGLETTVARCKQLRTLICWSPESPLRRALCEALQVNELLTTLPSLAADAEDWRTVVTRNPYLRLTLVS